MPQRRPMGSLESEVLAFLWTHDGTSFSPAEVLDGLGVELAYTTIMTILSRLWKKGLVEREPRGRAYAYRTKVAEADYAAQRMQEVLGATSDHAAAFNRFANLLSRRDARLLREALKDRGHS
jgi:predicted transcriptional regulator